MDMSYLASSFYLLVGLGCVIYFAIYLVFRRTILSISDPLNYHAFLLAFSLAGVLVVPSSHVLNMSYLYVLILIGLYIVAGAFFSRKRSPIKMPRLGVERTSQVLFTMALSGLIILNVVINQIFGVMALFQGTQARAAYGSVAAPSLYLLAPFIGIMVLLVYLITEFRVVRILAGVGVSTSIVSTILGGSKSALFSILLIILAADYVLNLKLSASRLPHERLSLSKKIKVLRRSGVICAAAIALMLPAYLVLIGASSDGPGGALEAFAVRLFGGFDDLAIIGVKNIDLTSTHGINISDFYFYPLLKKFAYTPPFQSSGSYLIYLLSDDYRFATSGMNPNSSLAIELLLSNGSIIISSILITIISAVIFRLRAALLARRRLRMLDLLLWTLIVFGPFGVLVDGTYFVIVSYTLLGLYVVLNSLINALHWLTPGRKVFRFL
jgi:hypothetical protein